MSSPYPEIGEWIVPAAVKKATLTGVRPSGYRGKESGAFWLGLREAIAPVTAVVLPQGKGVDESPAQWRVSPEVFGAITRWATPRGLALLGIAHTHIRGVPARLSWADRHSSVRVPGILAIVIGNGGGDADHYDWGWYVYEEDDYRELSGTELGRRVREDDITRTEVWRADSEGVWPLNA